MKHVEIICFDADDTLWKNEDFYRETEHKFAALMKDYGEEADIEKELYQTEMQNLELLGYGIKPFVISMVETALRVSNHSLDPSIIQQILAMGKGMLEEPVVLLPDVKEVLKELHGRYRLIVATKGDLLDQERKLKRSSLSGYFHHIEIMSDKTVETYQELLKHLEVKPDKFLMIGNSMRSDILPPLELGGYAIHVPYELTWVHEMNVEDPPESDRFHKVERIRDVLDFFQL